MESDEINSCPELHPVRGQRDPQSPGWQERPPSCLTAHGLPTFPFFNSRKWEPEGEKGGNPRLQDTFMFGWFAPLFTTRDFFTQEQQTPSWQAGGFLRKGQGGSGLGPQFCSPVEGPTGRGQQFPAPHPSASPTHPRHGLPPGSGVCPLLQLCPAPSDYSPAIDSPPGRTPKVWPPRAPQASAHGYLLIKLRAQRGLGALQPGLAQGPLPVAAALGQAGLLGAAAAVAAAAAAPSLAVLPGVCGGRRLAVL